VPAVAETVPGYAPATWVGLFAPKSTPDELVKKINDDVQDIFNEAEFTEGFLAKQVLVGMPGTPQQFSDTIRRERAMWAKAIGGAGSPQN
jgi:tripartite-type tricarboxylate transporter receptor subunit TctC